MRFNIELYLQSAIAEKRRRQADYDVMLELVVGEVHPSQFSSLPPAPQEIESKAYLLGFRAYLS